MIGLADASGGTSDNHTHRDQRDLFGDRSRLGSGSATTLGKESHDGRGGGTFLKSISGETECSSLAMDFYKPSIGLRRAKVVAAVRLV